MVSPQISDHPIPSVMRSSSSHRAESHMPPPPPPPKPAPLSSLIQTEAVTRSPVRSLSLSKSPIPPRVATVRFGAVTGSPEGSAVNDSPARSLLSDAGYQNAAEKAEVMHQKERSFSSASSFQSPHRDADNPNASIARGSPMSTAWTVASVLRSPIGDMEPESPISPAKVVSPSVAANRMVSRESKSTENVGGGGGGGRGILGVESHTLKQPALLKAAVGLRILALVLSLISFSVMASDKTSGWDGDSFDRYREFRYCLTMNVLTFVYSTFQIYVQIHHKMVNKRVMSRRVSYYFDFSIDQILAYLLMSASSSAASRNGDWVSNFGSDKFTKKISGSLAMSFLAFFALASSSIISAYKFFSWNI